MLALYLWGRVLEGSRCFSLPAILMVLMVFWLYKSDYYVHGVLLINGEDCSAGGPLLFFRFCAGTVRELTARLVG